MTIEVFTMSVGVSLFILMLPALYRVAVGPTSFDRLVAVNVIGTKTAVLLVVIGYLVLGRDDTIRLDEQSRDGSMKDPEFQKNLLQRIDRTNDLLTSIRNSALLLIVIIVVVPLLFLLFSKGCYTAQRETSAHVSNSPNTYD